MKAVIIIDVENGPEQGLLEAEIEHLVRGMRFIPHVQPVQWLCLNDDSFAALKKTEAFLNFELWKEV